MKKIVLPGEEIAKRYLAGESLLALSRSFNVDPSIIGRHLKETGTPKRVFPGRSPNASGGSYTLTQVDEDGRVCTRCLEWKNWEQFQKNAVGVNGRSSACRKCLNASDTVERSKRRSLKKSGWTPEMKEIVIILQDETCANPNCDAIPTDADHDHETGEPRGVMCHNCNKALGHLKEDPELIRGLIRYAEQCQNAKKTINYYFTPVTPVTEITS